MSDFFIGQLLVFATLVPVLLEPFIRSFRKVEGIPLLSIIAFCLCLGTVASGIRVLFFPLFVFTLIILFSKMGRFVVMAKKRESSSLPDEIEDASPSAKMLSAIALAILAALAALSAHFQPEFSYKSASDISVKTERAALSASFNYRFNVFGAEEASSQDSNIVLLYFPSFPAGRETLLEIAAEQGFTALSAHWSGKNLYYSAVMNPEILRDFSQVIYSVGQFFTPAGAEAHYITRFEQAQGGVMQTVILDAARFARDRYKQENHGESVRLFAVAEGYACTSLAAVASANPSLFAGAAYLISEEGLNNFRAPEAGLFWQRGLYQAIPNSAAEQAGIVIVGGMESAFGFGEMTAEDPALAAIFGFARDEGRQLARLAAGRVLAWVKMRNEHLDQNENANLSDEAQPLAVEAIPPPEVQPILLDDLPPLEDEYQIFEEDDQEPLAFSQ